MDNILADCAKGRIWATIDMTDSFFQTRMHPDDIHKTAVSTPLGAYEWCIMPMGYRNMPAIHQWRVKNALCEYINEQDQCLLRGELREKQEGGKREKEKKNPESIYMCFLK